MFYYMRRVAPAIHEVARCPTSGAARAAALSVHARQQEPDPQMLRTQRFRAFSVDCPKSPSVSGQAAIRALIVRLVAGNHKRTAAITIS